MLVACATDFIKSNSFVAHNCKRETMGTGTGVSLKDLQKHLIKNVLGFEDHGIWRDTKHHLMVAPRKNATWAPCNKGLVDAKVAPKRNDYKENHVNQHFLAAPVKFRE